VATNDGLLAVFAHADDFLLALRRLRAEDFRIETFFSPVRLPEAQEIVYRKPSIVRLITLLGGIAGGLAIISLAVYAHVSFNLIVGGKPILPWIPWVVICFEGVILGAVLSTVAAWILKARLPRLKPVVGYNPRFSQDRFGVLVVCTDTERASAKALLEKTGAEEVHCVAW
jgi:hypothetical protein